MIILPPKAKLRVIDMNQLSADANDTEQNLHPQHRSTLIAPFNGYCQRWTLASPAANWTQRLLFPAGTRHWYYYGTANGIPLGLGDYISGTSVESNNVGFYGVSLGEVVFSQEEFNIAGVYKTWNCTARGYVHKRRVGASLDLIKFQLTKWTRLTNGDETVEILVDDIPTTVHGSDDEYDAFLNAGIQVQMTPTTEFVSIRLSSVLIDFITGNNESLESWQRHFCVNILPVQ